MTPNQSLGLEQLRRIAQVGNALEILRVVEPSEGCSSLRVDISIFCGDMPRKESGLPLRDRERVTIWIDDNFPYDYPSATVAHRRFAGYPHVNWSFWLCLYQAPQTEWSPATGMFGYIARLELWFRKAAMDELDETGGALHPPVTYAPRGPMMIARCDAPVRDNALWIGLAELRQVSEHRVDITGWAPMGEEVRSALVGAAILLDRTMPLEFPGKLGGLLNCLEQRGVSLDAVFDAIRAAILHNGNGPPLYVVLGTPMRGRRGADLRQHLTAWLVDTFAADVVGMESNVRRTEARARDLGADEIAGEAARIRENVVNLFRRWAEHTDVTWCRMREDRPEVTVRRDVGRPAAAFAGKKVEVWGCGALGGFIAEWVLRAGAASLTVRDESYVSPGILVRQPYSDADIGSPKAEVLAARLQPIRPDCPVVGHVGDVVESPLGVGIISEDADIVIDATASNVVLTKLEEVWQQADARRVIASVVIDRDAERMLAVIVQPGHSGGPMDAVRRMKLEACRDDRLKGHLDAFFPDPPPPAFQPEPGCSDATFVGSAADAAMLSAAAVNFIGRALVEKTSDTASGCFLNASGDSKDRDSRVSEFGFSPDLVFLDPSSGYETRIDPAAWRTIQSWKNESGRVRGPDVETGGLLFGEMNELLRIIWVSDASGPPPDSQHAAEEFVCGISGTEELNRAITVRTRKSSQYVGTWHTHPVSAAIPSGRDLCAIDQLLLHSPVPADRLLLLILGQPRQGPEVTASVFLRTEFESLHRTGNLMRAISRHSVPEDSGTPRRRVGLALSGGGSRAIAFHLGCLRALHDRRILPQLQVISTVSGGSVIGAMYAYGAGSFSDFEHDVVELLRRGLVGAIGRRTVLSPRLLQILGTKVTSGLAANIAFLTRFLVGQLERRLFGGSKARGLAAQRIQPPFRRWVSRTTAFEEALRDLLFGNAQLNAPRRGEFEVVINACELRTGTAFRFGSRESGSWRYGTVLNNEVAVATAVAASAAFPALLPAIDRYFDFVPRAGAPMRERVILTDGGVYENLGVTCMTPERDSAYSTNVFSPEYIICCDAGPGQFEDVMLPYGWTTRMRRSFEATHRQVQHGLQKIIHLQRQAGGLRGFVYSYLGQQDSRLPIRPLKLVPREGVVHYPTDFSAMSEEDIDLLSSRGEQLTRQLLDFYCPEL